MSSSRRKMAETEQKHASKSDYLTRLRAERERLKIEVEKTEDKIRELKKKLSAKQAENDILVSDIKDDPIIDQQYHAADLYSRLAELVEDNDSIDNVSLVHIIEQLDLELTKIRTVKASRDANLLKRESKVKKHAMSVNQVAGLRQMQDSLDTHIKEQEKGDPYQRPATCIQLGSIIPRSSERVFTESTWEQNENTSTLNSIVEMPSTQLQMTMSNRSATPGKGLLSLSGHTMQSYASKQLQNGYLYNRNLSRVVSNSLSETLNGSVHLLEYLTFKISREEVNQLYRGDIMKAITDHLRFILRTNPIERWQSNITAEQIILQPCGGMNINGVLSCQHYVVRGPANDDMHSTCCKPEDVTNDGRSSENGYAADIDDNFHPTSEGRTIARRMKQGTIPDHLQQPRGYDWELSDSSSETVVIAISKAENNITCESDHVVVLVGKQKRKSRRVRDALRSKCAT